MVITRIARVSGQAPSRPSQTAASTIDGHLPRPGMTAMEIASRVERVTPTASGRHRSWSGAVDAAKSPMIHAVLSAMTNGSGRARWIIRQAPG